MNLGYFYSQAILVFYVLNTFFLARHELNKDIFFDSIAEQFDKTIYKTSKGFIRLNYTPQEIKIDQWKT